MKTLLVTIALAFSSFSFAAEAPKKEAAPVIIAPVPKVEEALPTCKKSKKLCKPVKAKPCLCQAE